MAVDLEAPPASARHPAPTVLRPGPSPGGRLLTGAVLLWFALMILLPTAALIRRAFAGGFAPFAEALASPEARRAFWLTGVTTLAATVVNTLFGVAFAVVLARHHFPGKTLIDGLTDLPFAVSPVVAGLMLIVLFGPQGWLGRPLEAAGVRVV